MQRLKKDYLCAVQMKAKKGSKVKVEYEGKFENGEVFDSSTRHGQPLEFTVGEGAVISGFDNSVEGMDKGEEKEITLEPKEAYGDERPELKQEIPRDKFPADKEVKEGMVLAMSTPDGKQIPVRIIKVNDKNVTIDLNHPLAGKKLIFKIKLVDIM